MIEQELDLANSNEVLTIDVPTVEMFSDLTGEIIEIRASASNYYTGGTASMSTTCCGCDKC
jgi:hypothetical protein